MMVKNLRYCTARKRMLSMYICEHITDQFYTKFLVFFELDFFTRSVKYWYDIKTQFGEYKCHTFLAKLNNNSNGYHRRLFSL